MSSRKISTFLVVPLVIWLVLIVPVLNEEVAAPELGRSVQPESESTDAKDDESLPSDPHEVREVTPEPVDMDKEEPQPIIEIPESSDGTGNNFEIIKTEENENTAPVPDNPNSTININNYKITENVEFRQGVPPSTINTAPLSPAILESLTHRWTQIGHHCNFTRHKSFWKYFWTNIEPEGTIESILNGSKSTQNVCNGLKYQRCDRLTSTCDCDKDSIYDKESDSCQLVEGGRKCGYGWLPIFKDNDIKKQLVKDFPLSCVPHSDCFNQLGCWDSRECEILQHASNNSNYKPKILYSFCNPKHSSQFEYTQSLLESNIKKSINYEHWLKHGNRCRVSHNFDRTTPHEEMKRIVIASYENHQKNFYQMCNPFKNEKCHSEKKVCLCTKGFLNQKGKCRLVPGYSCEWNPKLEIKLQNNIISETNATPQKVQCIKEADCQNKICVCLDGKKCPKYVEENWIGSEGSTIVKSVPFYYFILTIYMFVTNQCIS